MSKFYRGKKVGLVYDNVPINFSKAVKYYVKAWNKNLNNTCTFVIELADPYLTSVYRPPDVTYNEPFKILIRTKYNESISTGLINGNLNIIDKYKVSKDNLINFICQKVDELKQKYYQSKQIFKSFEQCGLNHLKPLDSLTETSMYRALNDQHKVVTLSNKLKIISNHLSGCEIDETNE